MVVEPTPLRVDEVVPVVSCRRPIKLLLAILSPATAVMPSVASTHAVIRDS